MNSFFSGSIRRLEKYCKGGVFHEQKKVQITKVPFANVPTGLGKVVTQMATTMPEDRSNVLSMAKTRKEVADKIRDILVKKQSGTYVAPSQYRLDDWMTQWLQTYAKNAIKPSTYISYEGYIYNHINPSLGGYPIQRITTPMVQEFYNQKFQSGSK